MKIMNTKRRLAVLGVLVALCLVGSLVTPVLADAPPPMNHQFYGEVTSQGAPVDEGVPVVAKVNGEPCGETTVFIRDAESRYNFEVSGEVASPGDPIKFYVDGVEAALYDVETGETLESYPFGTNFFRTELNLTVADTTAPTFVSVAVTDPDEFYKAGDTISFDVDLGEEGLTVTADLSVLDSALASDFALTDDEDGTYSGTTSALSSETMVEGVDTAVTFTATDAADNFRPDDSLTLTIDKTAPTISATSPATDADIKAGFTVDYTFDEAVASGTIAFTATDPAGTTQTYTLVSGDFASGAHTIAEADLTGITLVDGTVYSIAFDATDPAGNPASTVTNTGITYDTGAPTVTIDIPDYINAANEAAVPVTITSNEDGTYSYTISDGTTDVTGTGSITAGVDVDLTEDLSGLAEGSVTADASVEDAAGNMGDAPQDSATKDTETPVVEITSPSEDALLNTLEVTIEGTATEVAEVVVGGQTAPVVDGAFSVILTLSEGANSVTATASDAAGNVGSDTVNFNIVVVTHTLTMAVVGVGTVTPESGDYPEGDMTITATIPASGWEFAGWTTTDMAEIADPTSAETTLTLDKDKTVTATFTEVVTYDLTVASTAGGTVTDPGEDAFTYNAGTVVSLVAVPEDGYTFGWWSGDIGMIADVNVASTTITMNSDKSIVANFVEFSAPENVSVTEIDPGVESVTVTIEPVEELDVTQMPAGIDPQEAYVVESTGTGSFTLIFTDVSNASDIRVYKVVDSTWTLQDVTVVDATTIEVTMTVGDPILVFALPPATIGTVTLPAGWNLLSTPIKLDADSDTLEQILGESLANIEVSYRWDTQSQQWAVPTGYELLPLEAVYVKVSSGVSATAEFIPSGELSQPPIRELQPGLNLIGPAPALVGGVFPDTPLNQALISIAEAEGGLRGYTIVVSPEHNQPGWAYALGGEIKDLLPYKGYWVVMENADTLYGFSTTPISP